MRSTARRPADLSLPDKAPGTWSTTVPLVALTPIYKGGANARGIEAGRPFRGASVRGQLRYWWRATSPLADTQALWEAERRLWGGVFGEEVLASQVRIGLSDQRSRPIPQPGGTKYVLWTHERSLEKGAEDRDAFHAEGASARLHIDAPEGAAPQVQRALRAWLLAGGVGSRSRRGAGQVWHDGYDGLPRSFASGAEWLAALEALVPPRARRDWASLGGAAAVLAQQPKQSAQQAWAHAVDVMQSVRMSENGQQRPPVPTAPHPAVLRADFAGIAEGRSFVSARAALGLPIPFRWRDGGRWRTVFMKPGVREQDRFPSPILICVVPVGRQFLPAFLALRVPFPASVEVDHTPGRIDPSGVPTFLQAVSDTWRSPIQHLGGAS